MKFIISSGKLLKHLSYVSGVVGSNPSLPILENFLFMIGKTRLTIIGTDIDTVIKTSLEIDCDGEGDICVPSKIIIEWLKTISEQPVTINIKMEQEEIVIKTLSGNYVFKGESARHFPKSPSDDKSEMFIIKSFVLLDAINNTLFTVPNDETRLNLNGVYFDLSENSIVFVSTDGHRLVRYAVQNITLPSKRESFIVPKKPLIILKNLIPDDDSELTLGYSSMHLFVKTDKVDLVCSLLDATFPDYKSVIPQNNSFQLSIEKMDLQKALKRVSIFSSKSNHLVKFLLKGNTLTLIGEDEDFNSNADEVLNCQYSGDEMSVGFNSKSLIELLSAIKTSYVTMKLGLPSKPVIILPSENNENEDLLMLQIPLILTEEEK